MKDRIAEDRGRPSGVSAEVVIDGHVFEVVKEFDYLGTLVTRVNAVSRED